MGRNTAPSQTASDVVLGFPRRDQAHSEPSFRGTRQGALRGAEAVGTRAPSDHRAASTHAAEGSNTALPGWDHVSRVATCAQTRAPSPGALSTTKVPHRGLGWAIFILR